MTFGAKLRRARRRKGLTQTELAALAGIGQDSISQYERDAVTPRALTAYDIACVLGVTLEWLCCGDNSVKEEQHI